MAFVHDFAKDARETWANYQPVLTEASGILEVGTGLTCFALSSICLILDPSNRPIGPMGLVVPSKFMVASSYAVAQGIVKLAIPILAATSYCVYKSCY